MARYLAGESASDIGHRFGVTHPPVRRVLREAGVQMRPRGPYRRPLAGREQAVAELYRLGLSLRDIAALSGCSVVAVKWALARAGEPLRQRGSHATKAVVALRQQLLAELEAADEPEARQVAAILALGRQEGRSSQ